MVEGARLRLRRPVFSLCAYVGCFWSIETTPATRLRTLRDACATLSIESGTAKPWSASWWVRAKHRPKECPRPGGHCLAYASNRALILCSPAYQLTHLSSAVYD